MSNKIDDVLCSLCEINDDRKERCFLDGILRPCGRQIEAKQEIGDMIEGVLNNNVGLLHWLGQNTNSSEYVTGWNNAVAKMKQSFAKLGIDWKEFTRLNDMTREVLNDKPER